MEKEAARARASFRGESSCSSSGCHGGAGEKHDQCLRYNKFDIHTRSYATLTLARSARIADVLKLGDPVQSARCTVCHAPFQTIATNDTLRHALDPVSGVSCENCHGGAENWLLSHTRKDFTHQDRVNLGMRDLNNLYVRANTCVACHQNVDNDILAAGHPELIFEMDGQCVSEPKHWAEEKSWSGPKSWFVGQAVALRETSWQLGNEKSASTNQVTRQLALQWLLETIQPAVPNVKFSMQLGIDNPNERLDVRGRLWGRDIALAAATNQWSDATTRKCIDTLAATSAQFRDASKNQPLQARRAERLVLALDRLISGVNDDALAKRVDAPLAKLFKDAQSLPDFNPTQFADDLEAFQKSLTSTP